MKHLASLALILFVSACGASSGGKLMVDHPMYEHQCGEACESDDEDVDDDDEGEAEDEDEAEDEGTDE